MKNRFVELIKDFFYRKFNILCNLVNKRLELVNHIVLLRNLVNEKKVISTKILKSILFRSKKVDKVKFESLLNLKILLKFKKLKKKSKNRNYIWINKNFEKKLKIRKFSIFHNMRYLSNIHTEVWIIKRKNLKILPLP